MCVLTILSVFCVNIICSCAKQTLLTIYKFCVTLKPTYKVGFSNTVIYSKRSLFMISTKGRYSLRILLDLAEHRNGKFIPMKDVAKRQGISLKYIERLLPALKEGGLIESLHGKGGGYRLTREPEQYTIWEILLLSEGDLAPVECLREHSEQCTRSGYCKTLPIWQGYYKMIKDYFSSVTLADIAGNSVDYDYII